MFTGHIKRSELAATETMGLGGPWIQLRLRWIERRPLTHLPQCGVKDIRRIVRLPQKSQLNIRTLPLVISHPRAPGSIGIPGWLRYRWNGSRISAFHYPRNGNLAL
jgi:hypothetical protein